MTIIKTHTLSAKNIKKFLKMEGVKVLRCCQNGDAVLVTVANEDSSLQKAIKFFANFDLTKKSGEAILKGISTSEKYVDFGSVYSVTVTHI